MKRLTLLLSFFLSLPAMGQFPPEYCNGSMDGLAFYAAGIAQDKSVHCHYRYCYYNCTYKSYTIPGPFKKTGRNWDNEGHCYSVSSYDCQFERDDQRK